MINFNNISTKSIIKFVFLWLILSGIYVVALSAATQALPRRIGWATESIYPLSILFALIASFIAVYRGSENETIDQAFKSSALIGAFGAGVLVIVYMVSIFLFPSDVVTTNQLESALINAGLSEEQKQKVLKLLEQDYVTTEELQNAGLNPTQIQQVIEIIKTGTPSITPAPEPIPDSMCYIRPMARYATVSIRREPDTSYENAVGYLARGENIRVIGLAYVGNDIWWKVEINHGVGSVEGWVIGWAVDTSNQDSCNKVPRVEPP